VNYRHANSAVTAGIVAPRHAMPWCGEQDHNDNHASTYDDIKTRPEALLAKFTIFSLPQPRDHSGRENPSLYVTWSLNSI
jgi:hypothetical protein